MPDSAEKSTSASGVGLRSRIFHSFLLASLPVMVLLLLAVELLLVPAVRESSREELENATYSLRQGVEASVTVAIRSYLRAIAEHNRQVAVAYLERAERGEFTVAEARSRIEAIFLKQKVGSSGYVYCLDSAGSVPVHPREGVKGTNLIEFDFIQKQIEKKDGYIEYEWKNPGEKEKRPKALYMVYFEPFDWIISASSYREEFSQLFHAEDLQETVQGLRFGEDGYAYVVSQDGTLIVHPVLQGQNIFAQEGVSVDFMKTMLERGSGYLEYRWRNKGEKRARRKAVVYDTLPELGWLVCSAGYMKDLEYPVWIARSIAYGTALLLLLTGGVAAYLLSGRLTRPLDQMIKHLDEIVEQGDATPFAVDGDDEFGRLAEEFNAFLARIAEQNDTLQQQQEQLHHSQKMEAVGQLAGGIAHDFNNMLGGIVGNVDLMLLQLPADSLHQDRLEMILECSEKASRLVEKLLSFARKHPPASTPVNLKAVLKDAASLLLSTMDPRIELHQQFLEEPITVIGDQSRLQSAILNLLINASQSMPEGGDIQLTMRTKELDAEYCNASFFDVNPGRFVEIEICDTGAGIAPEHLPRIFDPFFTTKDVGKGTGLGLASVHGTVQQHRGAITVQSEVNRGTCFRILLPRADTEHVRESTASKPAVVQGSGTILVVDDEQVMRSLASSILENIGYEVDLAVNGSEALALLKADPQRYDLVLLDMIMPVMNGRDCFRGIKKICPDLPVILSSGFTREEDASDMKADGLAGFVRKPYRSSVLSHAIQDILGQ